MDKSTWARTGIAGAVAGLGLAVGGVALASADGVQQPDATSERGFGGSGHLHVRGFYAEGLAEALGLDQNEVEAALEQVREQLEPVRPELFDGELPLPPTEDELAERQAAFAAALAEALGISEERVTDALESLRADAEARGEELKADLRERLAERLDSAVEEGTLTESDKESVLKAYDAGVLGGPMGGPMGGPLSGGFLGGHVLPGVVPGGRDA